MAALILASFVNYFYVHPSTARLLSLQLNETYFAVSDMQRIQQLRAGKRSQPSSVCCAHPVFGSNLLHAWWLLCPVSEAETYSVSFGNPGESSFTSATFDNKAAHTKVGCCDPNFGKALRGGYNTSRSCRRS